MSEVNKCMSETGYAVDGQGMEETQRRPTHPNYRTRVAKGWTISGKFPLEFNLGNFENITYWKLSMGIYGKYGILGNFMDFRGTNWEYRVIYSNVSYPSININNFHKKISMQNDTIGQKCGPVF